MEREDDTGRKMRIKIMLFKKLKILIILLLKIKIIIKS